MRHGVIFFTKKWLSRSKFTAISILMDCSTSVGKVFQNVTFMAKND